MEFGGKKKGGMDLPKVLIASSSNALLTGISYYTSPYLATPTACIKLCADTPFPVMIKGSCLPLYHSFFNIKLQETQNN